MTGVFALAQRQIDLDRQVCAWLPILFERKRARLRMSPHGFLRGTAGLFYDVLRENPDLADGPPGVGVIVGDMHLENVGAYRTDDDQVVFDLNDFDDATLGPFRLDVLRALTSVLLALHGFEISGPEAPALAQDFLRGYRSALFATNAAASELPAPMAKLIQASRQRSKSELLDARAPKQHGVRKFIRGERYLDLLPALSAQVPSLLEAYKTALGPRLPERAESWVIEDSAQRIAGTGSLGSVRIAILIKDSADNERILELKQQRPASAEELIGTPEARSPSERVVLSARALVHGPPRMLAALPPVPAPVGPGQLSLIGRQLFPQEDKLALGEVKKSQLPTVVEAVGRILGTAHARGGPQPHGIPPWTDRQIDELLVRALELTGLFEAVHYAYVKLTDVA